MNLLSAAPVIAPVIPSGTIVERGQSLFGLFVFLILSFLIGRLFGARKIVWRVIIWGVILQFAFGSIVIFAPGLLANVQAVIQSLLDVTIDGARLVFGNLVDYVVPVDGNDGKTVTLAAVIAFKVLPTIIFISMLTSILYYTGILTLVVKGLAWIMQKTMGTSGAETLSTAANIFVGQTEAPLIVKPFLARATKSELMAIMVGGFANIASGVLVVYSDWLSPYVQNAGGHLAAACFISAPATLIVAKLLIPETSRPETSDTVHVEVEKVDANLLDAATRGTSEGMRLAVNVGAMLIAFTALVSLINIIIGWAGHQVGVDGVSLQGILGTICSPIAWLCGVPWQECGAVGSLLGIKTALNEFVAYSYLHEAYVANPNYLSPRTGLLTTYALCGFANIASVGIQIGGISVLAPERRHDLSKIGFLAMVGGILSTCMGACVVGVLM